MKIVQLDLLAFGPFTDVSLDLHAGQFGLHVIYGPNEAGKSSALRALRQLFFGIDVQCTDSFVHPYPNLRIGAVLEDPQGQRLHAIRRKANKDPLRGADDATVIDAAVWNRLLHGLSQEEFCQRFGIDHQELVRGGQDLVRGGGDLGHLLFAAGAGLADLGAVQAQLATDADQLFLPRGANPRINQALAQYRDAVSLRKAALLRPTEWLQHDESLKAAEADRRALDQQIRERRAQQQQTQRLRQALPLLAKRGRLRDELQRLADVPPLSEDFSQQRREAATGLAAAENLQHEAAEALKEIQLALSRLEVADAVLSQAAAIQQLHEQLHAYRQARNDRPGLIAQRERLEEEVRGILRELGREQRLADAGRWQLSRTERARIQELGTRYTALTEKAAAARQRAAELTQELEDLQRAQERGAAPPETEALQQAIRRARRTGDLELRLTQLRDTQRRLQQQADIDLQRLELWSGSLAELERLPLPAAETIERCEVRLNELELQIQTLDERQSETRLQIAQREQEIERLRQQQDALTEEDLTAARRQRDAGWELVRRSWQGTPPPDAEAVARYVAQCPPAQDLAQAFVFSLQAADQAADRLRRESRQVAEKARLLADRLQLETRRDEFADQRGTRAAERDACQAEWQDLWAACHVRPRTPREMRAWLAKQHELVRVAAELRRLRDEGSLLEQQVAEHRAELGRELSALAATAVRPQATLAELIDRAEAVVAQATTARETRRQWEREFDKLAGQRPRVEQEIRDAEAALSQWRADWAAAMQRLELSADASPAEADEVSRAVSELLAKTKEADSLGRRIASIDQYTEQFAAQVRDVASQIAVDFQTLAAERAVLQLWDRLQDAQQAQARRAELQDRRRREEKRHRDAQSKTGACRSVLESLCREAGGATPEALPELEQRAQQRRDAERQARECDDQLEELAAGTSLDAFLAQIATGDPDRLAAQLAEHEAELEDLERRKVELSDTIGRAQAELQRMDGSDRAAQAQEDAQLRLTQIRSDAEQYVRLRLAAAVLQRAVERYREKHQGAVLRQASRWFADLTLSSFVGLRDDYNDRGEPVLVGVRPDGRTSVTVEGMSDGTRDQLYLALRLASLAHYLEQHEPWPFVVDDILVHFDDQRAAAALRILAELSARTQILFFTHHQHLVDLARQHVRPDQLFVQHLSPRANLCLA